MPAALVVRSSLPVKSVAELVDYAKRHPGELTYGSTGAGLFLHLNGLLFGDLTGISLKHVPYGQGSPFSDLLGGHIDMVFDALAPTIENVKAGGCGLSALPDVPTFAEGGLPNYSPYGIVGLLAPKGTPEPIVTRMQSAGVKILKDLDLRKLWESQGNVLVGSSPAEFANLMRSESERWRKIIANNNLRME